MGHKGKNKKWCYDYPRPAYTADCLIFTRKNEDTQIVLIKRKHNPFKDMRALPGGFVDIDEKGIDAAKRELFEETGIIVEKLFEFGIFDTPGRDPRGRTVSAVFYGFVNNVEKQMNAGDDASDVSLFSVNNLPELAFDHKEIIEKAVKELL